MTAAEAQEQAHRISKTSRVVIREIPARLWRVDAQGRRVEVDGVYYSARYEEPGYLVQSSGDTEAGARYLLADLLASNLAAGLL